MTNGALPSAKEMRLRYAGKCRNCNADLSAGTVAVYDRESKTVTCSECSLEPSWGASTTAGGPGVTAARPEPATMDPAPEPEVFAGVAGASAKREFERRSAKREARIRQAHPKIGGLILALSEDPQSTKAWAVGAVGEEKLGRRLDGIKGDSVHVLHDRLIRGTKANIDHIVVCPFGVYMVDAKNYTGAPYLRTEGGFFRGYSETLMVGSRNCTKLVAGVHKQVARVVTALQEAGLDEVRVAGLLCFVDAEWPILSSAFSTDGIGVLWPRKVVDLARKSGPIDVPASKQIFQALAAAFPAA